MSSIYLRGRIYWYKATVDGKARYQSLKTKNKRVASALQKKIDGQSANPKADKFSSAGVASWSDRYIDWLNAGVTVSHLKHCRGRLKKFIGICGDIQPEEITIEVVQKFLDGLEFSPKTINDYKFTISKFLRYCYNNGLAVDIAAAKAAMVPPKKRRVPRFLDINQECDLLRKAYRLDKTLYLKIIIAIRTGMRMSELIRMRWEHVDFIRNTILVPQSKNGRPRSIPLHKTLRKRLYKIRKLSGPVFAGSDRTWIRELSRIKDCRVFTEGMDPKATGRGWHLFRHTFASRLVQAGVDIFKVSKWLGHTSVANTMIYAHLSPNNSAEDINRL